MAFLNTSREVDQERVAKALIAKTSRTIYSKEYKAEAQINVAMLDKHQAKKVMKHLLLRNVLMDEMRSATEQNYPGRAKILFNVVAGSVRKYRCTNLLNNGQI